MKEKNLLGYFEGKITADTLAKDVEDSPKRISHDVSTVFIEIMDHGEFEIKTEHLIKLCNDVISGKIQPSDLNTIAFSLIASDFFTWNSDTIEGDRIATTIFDWDNPEINFEITANNVHLWKEYLLTGEYRLDQK